jgi:hypothetical protein
MIRLSSPRCRGSRFRWWRGQRVLRRWEPEERRCRTLSAGRCCCIMYTRHAIRRGPLMSRLLNSSFDLVFESDIHLIGTVEHRHEQRTRHVHRSAQTLSQRASFSSRLAPFRHRTRERQEHVVCILESCLPWSRTRIPRCVLHRRGRE